MIYCPLCHGITKTLEFIDVGVLIDLWRNLKIEISPYIILDATLKKQKCPICELIFFYPLMIGDDKFYRALSKWEWYYTYPGKGEYPFAASFIRSGMKVLDVGSGIGEFQKYLKNDVYFMGIELNSSAVDYAKKHNRNVKKINIFDLLEYHKNTYDVVTCFQVLEHISDVLPFCCAMVELCKYGGEIIIAVPNNEGFVGSAVNNALNMPPHHVLYWSKKPLYYLANHLNLNVLDYFEEPLADIHLNWAHQTLIFNIIRKFFFISHKSMLIDSQHRYIRAISRRAGNFTAKVWPKLIKKGHSSIIRLQKPRIKI